MQNGAWQTGVPKWTEGRTLKLLDDLSNGQQKAQTANVSSAVNTNCVAILERSVPFLFLEWNEVKFKF
jgi:hypothetical protein